MSDLPKRELGVVGAACAVCCAPLIVGAVVAAPIVAVGAGAIATAAAVTAVVRKRRNPKQAEALP